MGASLQGSCPRIVRPVTSVADLRARLLKTAQSVKETHEQIASTMEALAQTGDEEHAERRRALADKARTNAEKEASQIAGLLRGLDHQITISSPRD